jgi:hypothetical protein
MTLRDYARFGQFILDEAHGPFEQVIRVYPQDRIVIALNSAVLRPTEAQTRDAIRTLIASLYEAAKR